VVWGGGGGGVLGEGGVLLVYVAFRMSAVCIAAMALPTKGGAGEEQTHAGEYVVCFSSVGLLSVGFNKSTHGFAVAAIERVVLSGLHYVSALLHQAALIGIAVRAACMCSRLTAGSRE
jgi:hypothetical protein